MAKDFKPYFAFHLSRNFVRYETEWAEVAANTAENLGDVIYEDFFRKYSPSEKNPLFLVSILETDANFEAVFLYRCLRHLLSQDENHFLLPVLSRLMKLRCGAEIYYTSSIGPGFRIVHSQGLVIGANHRIGNNFTCYQGVTIGTRDRGMPGAFAEIGSHCSLYAGSKVLAPLKIGDHVKLGANSILLSDAVSHSTYVGAPAQRIAS